MAVATGVKAFHPDYDKYLPKWKRCRDVVSGQDAIYKAALASNGASNSYLPRLTDEELSDYTARLYRAGFYNASWRTIAGFIGMLFRKPPALEVPKAVEALLDDVTMTGVTFSSFAQDCALEDLEVSRLGILIDYPQNDKVLTLAQAEALGLRPSMKQYKAEAIRNWQHSRINNKTVLSQVRLTENHVINKSEFESKEETHIRVLDLEPGTNFYRVRVFKEDNEEQVGEDYYPLMNGQKMTFIPFYFIGPDGSDSSVDDPIMIDLFDLNLKHFKVTADYEHGCHLTALPTAYVSGYENTEFDSHGNAVKPKVYVGGTSILLLPTGATADYMEFTGTGIGALEKNLERKEAQMAAIGARMLAPEKSGVEAAETLAMRHNGENSILAAIAIAVSQGLTEALKTFCAWAGYASETINFEISREFIPVIADAQLITQLIALVQSGNLDKESLFDWLKRADLVKHDLTYEEMQGRIESDPPPAPLGHNGGPKLEDEPKPEPKAE